MSHTLYEREIAPQLAELARLCKQHGLGFVAVCQYADASDAVTGLARTEAPFPERPHAGLRATTFAARAGGDVDALVAALISDGATHGHASEFLSSLDVPREPAGHAPVSPPMARPEWLSQFTEQLMALRPTMNVVLAIRTAAECFERSHGDDPKATAQAWAKQV